MTANLALDAVRALTDSWRARAVATTRLTTARAVASAVADPLDDPEVQAAAQALHDARRQVEQAEMACWRVVEA